MKINHCYLIIMIFLLLGKTSLFCMDEKMQQKKHYESLSSLSFALGGLSFQLPYDERDDLEKIKDAIKNNALILKYIDTKKSRNLHFYFTNSVGACERIGTITYEKLRNNNEYIYLSNFEVKKEYRGLGLGTYIFKATLHDIVQQFGKNIEDIYFHASPYDIPENGSLEQARETLYTFYEKKCHATPRDKNSGLFYINLKEAGYFDEQ